MIIGWIKRKFTIFAHKYDWHYAPIIGPLTPGWEYQRWCQWCGFRESYKYNPKEPPVVIRKAEHD